MSEVYSETSDTYKYNHLFQSQLVSLILTEPRFLRENRDVVEAKFFEDKKHNTIIKMVINYFDEYGDKPPVSSLLAMWDDYARKSNVPIETKVDIIKEIKKLSRLVVSNKDHIQDTIIKFGQNQALKSSIIKSIHIMKKGEDFSQIRSLIDDAMKIGCSRDPGLDFLESVRRLEDLIKDDRTYNKDNKIPTLIEQLDKDMHGGLGIGEIGVILAPPKRGKSSTLVNLGFGALVSGMKVMHYTLELKEIDLVAKYVARYTGKEIHEIMCDPVQARKDMENKFIRNNQMRFKYFPPRSIGVEGIRSHLSYLQTAYEFNPDLIIVDYADRLKVRGTDVYREMGEVYDGLIHIADDFGAAVWTASQVGRAGAAEKIVSETNIADSWMKIANADVVVSLNRDETDIENNTVRIFENMFRRHGGGREILCNVDYGRCLITQSIDSIEDA